MRTDRYPERSIYCGTRSVWGTSFRETICSSGLVGISIDNIALERLAAHLDEMAMRDCVDLVGVAQEWLKQPRRTEFVLAMEHRLLHNMLSEWKSDPERLRKIVKLLQPKDAPASNADVAAIELSDYVNSGSAAIAPMLDEASSIADAEDRALILEWRKPAWQRKPLSQSGFRTTMGLRLMVNKPGVQQGAKEIDVEAARIHLLGTHGAIRRFLWENSRLPTSLDELKLPSLTTDPFTGKPLIYKVTGDHYELQSTGPELRADGDTVVGPISLPQKAP